MHPPAYFPRVSQAAMERWDKLEADPELAAPWRLLFGQVQSPRHVLSELLQNADDAGASDAWVGIDPDGTFFFEHNGDDFSEEQFHSLCRFGYSNKRNLYTIGFRGIGFKSIFSLGNPVSIVSPTLSVSFDSSRFTEPKWIECLPAAHGRTRVMVRIADEYRRTEIERNLADWLQSPFSLLFFRNIRCLNVGEQMLRWKPLSDGPSQGSQWVAFEGQESKPLLLVRSAQEPFPPDALDEIRKERMVAEGAEHHFPPCSVEIVLGAAGRLFVVLPTGGDTGLPFCCNAPLMLSPDRADIKSPAVSPTNRWLLDRLGGLASFTFLEWLANDNLPIEHRARAYALMPLVQLGNGEGDSQHGASVQAAFDKGINDCPVLLAADGHVVKSLRAIKLPNVALDVWHHDEIAKLLDPQSRPALCRQITSEHRQKLRKRMLVERVDNTALLNSLTSVRPPRPDTWEKLWMLWNFVQGHNAATVHTQAVPMAALRILPVHGSTKLHNVDEIIRVTSKPEMCRSEQDWEFLARRLLVLDAAWIQFISAREREAVEKMSAKPDNLLDPAARLLKQLGLDQNTGVTRMIDRVAKALVSDAATNQAEWVKLAHLAAALKAKTGENFRFCTKDGQLRSVGHGVFHDETGEMAEMLPPDYGDSHLIAPSYITEFESCSREEWDVWIASGQAGLVDLPVIEENKRSWYSKKAFEANLAPLQSVEGVSYPYSTGTVYTSQSYYLTDYDFPKSVSTFWVNMPEDARVWAFVARRLLLGSKVRWEKCTQVVSRQTSTNGKSSASVRGVQVAASWLRLLQTSECLPDKHGVFRRPSDLLRRTPETEPLLDVELFVDSRLDNEQTRGLLDALGVGSKPHGPERLLNCLSALALAPSPPVIEVEKWYRRLDQFTENCSGSDLEKISKTLADNKLVLSQDGDWMPPSSIFLTANEADAPGVPLVLAAVSSLRLWERLGVAARPTPEMAITWIKMLPLGKVTDDLMLRRVKALMKRFPVRIWSEVGRWLDLSGRWVPVTDLDHALTSRQRTAFSHLHDWVKNRVADLRVLDFEVVISSPFSSLPSLESSLEDRMTLDAGLVLSPQELPWLQSFGETLQRLELDDDEKTIVAREAGRRMASTQFQMTSAIQVTPFFEGKPSGTVKQQEVAWIGSVIFSVSLPPARLARLLPEHLGKVLPTDNLREALCYCYERSADDVTQYLEQNFTVSERAVASVAEVPRLPSEQPITTNIASDPGPVEVDPAPSETLPDVGSGDRPGEDSNETPKAVPGTPKNHKPAGPTLMERYARAHGFLVEGDAFVHSNGSRIAKTGHGEFPWQIHNHLTGASRQFKPVERCLERHPVEISHESWALIETYPERYSLLLIDQEARPIEVTGETLRQMRDKDIVTIYPATYRLKHRDV